MCCDVTRKCGSGIVLSMQALMNTVLDSTKMYRSNFASSKQSSQFTLPSSLSLLPLFVVALLKHVGHVLCASPRSEWGLLPDLHVAEYLDRGMLYTLCCTCTSVHHFYFLCSKHNADACMYLLCSCSRLSR